jgi:hypothetical protein
MQNITAPFITLADTKIKGAVPSKFSYQAKAPHSIRLQE